MNACFAVSPIIRGHGLRTFVEQHTPEQRYADVANWLQLGPLVEVQKNIRALRIQIKAAADDGSTLQRIDTQLSVETVQVVRSGMRFRCYFNANRSVLAPLDVTLELTDLATTPPTLY